MMLSTKGRYAVMAMVDIAQNFVSQPVSLQSIAERQQITLNYLEQIFAKLKKSGIVVSIKGPGGGYRLAFPPEDIFIVDIIKAAEESVKMTRCNANEIGGCMHNKAKCLTHDLWVNLENKIIEYLSQISLMDVCNQNEKQDVKFEG